MQIWAKKKLLHLIRPFGAPSPQGEGFGAVRISNNPINRNLYVYVILSVAKNLDGTELLLCSSETSLRFFGRFAPSE